MAIVFCATATLDTAYAIVLSSSSDQFHVRALELAEQMEALGTRFMVLCFSWRRIESTTDGGEQVAMIPPFDPEGDLPPGRHMATWPEFQARFCGFTSSDRRPQLCRRIEQLMADARASQIVERLLFGGSFVCARPAPNDFDCVVVLHAGTQYETLQPFQRWVADTREASRRYRGDIFVARADQATLDVYVAFFATNRQGKQVGLIEVTL
jgi:hypothetical protein